MTYRITPSRRRSRVKPGDDEGGAFYYSIPYRYPINKDTIPRSEILNQVQDDEERHTTSQSGDAETSSA
jgi:hypothetical protein